MNISQKRISRGMTQIDLAIKMSVAQNTISQWETGERNPNAHKLKKLAKLFGCSIDELLNEQDPKQNK